MTHEPETLSPIRLVEAALFTAGRPVALDELEAATGLDVKSIKTAVKGLVMEYDDRGEGTSLEVRQAGDKWAMQLKAVYVQHARTLAEMEIPKKLLKTLALIAFHQPLMQSDLVDMIGTKTYDHVHELVEFGLIKTRPDGVSKRLTTSPAFPEYFGIPATDTQQIRTYLAEKVGLTLKGPAGETPLGEFPEADAASADDSVEATDDGDVAAGADTDAETDEPESGAVVDEAETLVAADDADRDDDEDGLPEAAAVTVGLGNEATA